MEKRGPFTLDEAMMIYVSIYDPRAQDLIESCRLRVAKFACSNSGEMGAKSEEGFVTR
jgi:hypothetical protein